MHVATTCTDMASPNTKSLFTLSEHLYSAVTRAIAGDPTTSMVMVALLVGAKHNQFHLNLVALQCIAMRPGFIFYTLHQAFKMPFLPNNLCRNECKEKENCWKWKLNDRYVSQYLTIFHIPYDCLIKPKKTNRINRRKGLHFSSGWLSLVRLQSSHPCVICSYIINSSDNIIVTVTTFSEGIIRYWFQRTSSINKLKPYMFWL